MTDAYDATNEVNPDDPVETVETVDSRKPDPETVRLVIGGTRPPVSPSSCLYAPGLTYNVAPDDAQWLLDGLYAWREGDTPLPSRNEILLARERQIADQESVARAEQLRQAREVRKAAKLEKMALREAERAAHAQRVITARAMRKKADQDATTTKAEIDNG